MPTLWGEFKEMRRWNWQRCKPIEYLLIAIIGGLLGLMLSGFFTPDAYHYPPAKNPQLEPEIVRELTQVRLDSRGAEEMPPPPPQRANRTLTMQATAYTHAAPGGDINGTGDGLTATGIPVRKGVVAVDPNVIPLHTKLYIEGYGPAIAADVGGAIKGNRIDLFYECATRAMQFGRRTVEVTIRD